MALLRRSRIGLVPGLALVLACGTGQALTPVCTPTWREARRVSRVMRCPALGCTERVAFLPHNRGAFQGVETWSASAEEQGCRKCRLGPWRASWCCLPSRTFAAALAGRVPSRSRWEEDVAADSHAPACAPEFGSPGTRGVRGVCTESACLFGGVSSSGLLRRGGVSSGFCGRRRLGIRLSSG